MNNSPILSAKIFSVLFLLLTLLGFSSSLFPTGSFFLKTNTILILAHLVLTFGFCIVAYICRSMSIQALQTVGIIYILISGIGFIGLSIQINGEWPHVIYLNLLSYFQFGLGIVLCTTGSILKNHQNKIAV